MGEAISHKMVFFDSSSLPTRKNTLAGVLPAEQCKKALLTTLAHPDAVNPLAPYLFHNFAEALAVSGAERECLSLMKEYWGGMVDAGSDTFWECYDPTDAQASPYDDCHKQQLLSCVKLHAVVSAEEGGEGFI